MTMRARRYVLLVITVLLGIALGEVGAGWSDVEYYVAAAGLLSLIVLVGLPWLEFAPDGAFRRREPTR